MNSFKIYRYLATFLFLTGCGSAEFVVREYNTNPPVTYSPPPVQNPEPEENQVNYQTFYDALAPYGTWVQDPDYGYVWVPEVGQDFQPYQSRGHWVYTDYGWTWVSDYQWGWATFHYGRWRFSNDYGWIWVPGYTWGPAWVAWRTSGNYYGWAPLGPPAPREGYYNREYNGGARVSIGLNFSFNEAPEPRHWCFVPSDRVASPQVNNYVVNRSQNQYIYQNTTLINNVTTVNNINNTRVYNIVTVNNTTINNYNNKEVYVAGPPRADVERVTGAPITPISVAGSNRPGQTNLNENALHFYRPNLKGTIMTNNSGITKPAPKQIMPINQVTPVYNRTQERGVGIQNEASNISSTDAHPYDAARQRTQNNQGFTNGNINQGNQRPTPYGNPQNSNVIPSVSTPYNPNTNRPAFPQGNPQNKLPENSNVNPNGTPVNSNYNRNGNTVNVPNPNQNISNNPNTLNQGNRNNPYQLPNNNQGLRNNNPSFQPGGVNPNQNYNRPNQGNPNQVNPNPSNPYQNNNRPNQGNPNQGNPNQVNPNPSNPYQNNNRPNQGNPNQGNPNQGNPNQGNPSQPIGGFNRFQNIPNNGLKPRPPIQPKMIVKPPVNKDQPQKVDPKTI